MCHTDLFLLFDFSALGSRKFVTWQDQASKHNLVINHLVVQSNQGPKIGD
jgi:hypothetical protein